MPIQLTASHYGNPQVHISVVGIDLRNREVVLTAEYGDTVDGTWIPSGDLKPETHVIKNWDLETDGEVELVAESPVYDDLVSSARGLCTFVDKDADPNYVKTTLSHPTHGDLDVWVELSYSGVARQLYQWLLDEEVYVGTIG